MALKKDSKASNNSKRAMVLFFRTFQYIMILVFLSCAIMGYFSSSILAKAKKAYIFKGNIKQSDYSQYWQSIYYTYGVSKNKSIDDQVDDIIKQKEKNLIAMGYDVVTVDVAVTADVKNALMDKDTKALVYFGHGLAGQFDTANGDTITPQDIKDWATEKWLKDRLKAEGINIKFKSTDDLTDMWKKIKGKVDKQTWDKLRAEYSKINTGEGFHFDLEKADFHVCNSLENNDLADALMADNGDFTGFKSTGHLDPAGDKATEIRGNPVGRPTGPTTTSAGPGGQGAGTPLPGTGQAGTGTVPGQTGAGIGQAGSGAIGGQPGAGTGQVGAGAGQTGVGTGQPGAGATQAPTGSAVSSQPTTSPAGAPTAGTGQQPGAGTGQVVAGTGQAGAGAGQVGPAGQTPGTPLPGQGHQMQPQAPLTSGAAANSFDTAPGALETAPGALDTAPGALETAE
jgi:hypothetical protein